MRKVAIFVEGMTEQELTVALVSAIVGTKSLHIDLGRQWQGKVTITCSPRIGHIEYYILVIDCANDEQVGTQIRDQYQTLIAAGYTSIIGLRDVYPLQKQDIQTLYTNLTTALPFTPIVPSIHLAVMEVEAWFVGEVTHFTKIKNTLTVPYIINNGIDISTNSADSWNHPAVVLDNIYRLVNARYLRPNGKKTKKRVMRTINALSFEEIYLSLRNKLTSLDGYITSIETSLF